MPKTVPAKSTPKSIRHPLFLQAKQWMIERSDQLGNWLQRHWFRLLIIGLLTFILLRKDVSLQLDLQNSSTELQMEQLTKLIALQQTEKPSEVVTHTPILSVEREKQTTYVKRFAKVAQKEMTEFGIPASITLAQGLLETNAGESPLATKHNNHFGLKCFSRTCNKGHCTNFSDDSHKDFFRKFTSAWESYRAHSLLLKNGDRYQALFELPKTDYKAWANGLSSAGYATDKQYAKKLVRLVEGLRLYEYDA